MTLALTDVAAIVAVLAQTAALFYWGGKVSAMLKNHGDSITRIEEKLDGHLDGHSFHRRRGDVDPED